MNSKVQILIEKLKSLLRYGARTTRYKDIFDIYYLTQYVNKDKLIKCINKHILSDISLPFDSVSDIAEGMNKIFNNTSFLQKIKKSNKNWLEISVEEVLTNNVCFIKSMDN